MSRSHILYPANVCLNFPRRSDDDIPRSALLTEIDILLRTNQFVMIAGREGLGKTNLLAQFATELHPDRSVCIFITELHNHIKKFLAQDLCNQLEVLVQAKELSEDFLRNSDETTLQSRIADNIISLARTSRRNNKPFYFIIDGLHHFGTNEQDVVMSIVDMLRVAFGISEFKFLISFDGENYFTENYDYQVVRVTPLSSTETKDYLGQLEGLSEDDILNLHKLCDGNPSYISSVKKLLENTPIVERTNRISQLPSDLPELYEVRWQQMKLEEDIERALAILAYDAREYDIDRLCSIAQVERSSFLHRVHNINFIVIEDNRVSFESELFRKFVVQHTRYAEADILDILIKFHLENTQLDQQLSELPDYLERSGRYEQLLELLQADRFFSALNSSKSIGYLKKLSDMGLDASEQIRSETDIVRFILYNTVIKALDVSDYLQAEVEALMSLGHYNEALSLAQAVTLNEDKLQLLAALAKKKVNDNLKPETALLLQIKQLYQHVDVSTLGRERVISIAFDLVHTEPVLAIEMVESALNTKQHATNAFDFALAGLTIASLFDGAQDEQVSESIRSKVNDPIARRFITHFTAIFGNYSASQVISEIREIDDIGYKLHILRDWILNNREKDEAARVVEVALQLAIRTTEYPASARIFRELSAPLQYIAELSERKQLIELFDQQAETVMTLGPTEEIVKLNLSLAEAEEEVDVVHSANRFLWILDYINNMVDDLAAKVECLACLYASLVKIDVNEELYQGILSQQEIRDQFISEFHHLLSCTSDHFFITRGTIRGLAKDCPSLAIDCALALNIETRRDYALLEFIHAAVRKPGGEIDFFYLESALSKIKETEVRDKGVIEIVSRLDASDKLNKSIITASLPPLNRIAQIHDAAECALVLSMCFAVLEKSEASAPYGLNFDLEDLIWQKWEAIDVAWLKIETGFAIVEQIAEHNRVLAKSYLEQINKLKDEIGLYSNTAGMAYLHCIKLMIRSYDAFLSNSLSSLDDTFSQFEDLISEIPSNGEQAILWSELALKHFINNQSDNGKQIVNRYVKTLIERISDDDQAYKRYVISMTAPSLYLSHKQSTISRICQLPAFRCDQTLLLLIEYIVKKQLPTEEYEDTSQEKFIVEYEDALDICELMSQMTIDGFIYSAIDILTRGLGNAIRDNKVSRQQKTDIENKIDLIIKEKLPNKDYIKHDGYKILSLATAYHLRTSGSQSKSDWQSFQRDAGSIGNDADSAFILYCMSTLLPTKFHDLRSDFLKDAMSNIGSIPSIIDKTQHLELFANTVRRIDSALAKQAIRDAFNYAISRDDPSLEMIQRRVIDFAYRFEPDLADNLVAMVDNDPARQSTRENVLRRYNLLTMRQNLFDEVDNDRNTLNDIAEAATMRLALLNSGRVASNHHQEALQLMRKASQIPFHMSYNLVAYVIQNAVVRFRNDQNATRKHIYPLVEAAKYSARLVRHITAYNLNQQVIAKTVARETPSGNEFLVKSGDRERGITFIKNWIQNNATDELLICDPYFGPDELVEVLGIILPYNPKCEVVILSSLEHHNKIKKNRANSNWQQEYKATWSETFDQEIPPTTVIIAGTKRNTKLPVHDRYWLSNGSGLIMGTSFNGLGKRDSIISITSARTCESLKAQFTQYRLGKSVIDYSTDRIQYESFSL